MAIQNGKRANVPLDFLRDNVIRYRKLINGEKVDYAPFRLWFDDIFMCELADVSRAKYSSDFETMFNVQKIANERFYDLLDFGVHVSTLDIFYDEEAFIVDNPNVPSYKFLEPSLDNFDKYFSKKPFDQVPGVKRLAEGIEFFNQRLPAHKQINHYLGAWGAMDLFSIFRGTEKFFFDFYDNGAKVKSIFDYLHERTVAWIEYVEKRWGGKRSYNNLYDKIDIGEDFCAYLPPDMFAEFVAPYTAALFKKYKGKVCCSLHTDGDFATDGIANLKSLGIDELMGFSPNIDIKEFRKVLPDVILGGNIHPITVMVEGAPDDVKAASRYCFENANQNQKFVLCTGGAMSGHTKVENIDAFIEATYEIVKY
jgi:uroporphyrinogen decarboxylase